MIESNRIPEEYQQDYSIDILTKFLSGRLQAWIGYEFDEDGEKRIQVIFASSISDRKFFGIKSLNTEAFYGFRLVSKSILLDLHDKVLKFAKANKCNVIIADYSFNRVRDILLDMGFEKYRTLCRRFI